MSLSSPDLSPRSSSLTVGSASAAKARARIGEDLFDYLLAPEITDVPEEDDSLTNSILTNSN